MPWKTVFAFTGGEGRFEPTMKHTSERRAMAMERSNGWREQRQLFQPARSINPDQLTVSHYYIDNTLRSSRHCLDVKSRNMGDVQEVRQVLQKSRESINSNALDPIESHINSNILILELRCTMQSMRTLFFDRSLERKDAYAQYQYFLLKHPLKSPRWLLSKIFFYQTKPRKLFQGWGEVIKQERWASWSLRKQKASQLTLTHSRFNFNFSEIENFNSYLNY